MKKLIAIIIVLVSLTSVSCADAPDFTDWTYDQLVTLQHYVTLTLMQRPEWKEVTIPSGKWIVGVDIPEGSYSIKPVGSGAFLAIYNEKGRDIVYQGVRKEENSIGKIELKTAYTVDISDGSLIFAPAIILGF